MMFIQIKNIDTEGELFSYLEASLSRVASWSSRFLEIDFAPVVSLRSLVSSPLVSYTAVGRRQKGERGGERWGDGIIKLIRNGEW